MQIRLTLHPENGQVDLPISYNRQLQAMGYRLMGPELADRVHKIGFQAGSRSMRLFAFSRLLGQHTLDRRSGRIRFRGDVRVFFASPIDEMLREWATSLIRSPKVELGDNVVSVAAVALEAPKAQRPILSVNTLSPVTVYSTLYRRDGRPFTHYFEPGEPDFDRLITMNLHRKAAAIGVGVDPDSAVKVKPIGRYDRVIVRYKRGVVKAVYGRFRVEGIIPLLQLALDAGLGAKNSQGFGFCLPEEER